MMKLNDSPPSDAIAPKPESVACGQQKAKLFAIGLTPTGYISVGVVPMGVLAIGIVPMGVFSLGIVSMGTFAAGIVAMGIGAIGGETMSLLNLGRWQVGGIEIQAVPHHSQPTAPVGSPTPLAPPTDPHHDHQHH
jgi:hypothetical protein